MSLVIALLCALGVVLLFQKCFKILIRSFTSPLRKLPSPPSDGIFIGNLQAVMQAEFVDVHERWVREYGDTVAIHGLFGAPMLLSADPRAVNHILAHPSGYQKSEDTRRVVARLGGAGVLLAEGEQHRRQRRLMNPAFGPVQVRELTKIFLEKSIELKDALASEVAKSDSDGLGRVDILSWLSRTTLDIIGLAGFNYSFDAIEGEAATNGLTEAIRIMFEGSERGVFQVLRTLFPPARLIPTQRFKYAAQAQETIRRVGLKLIADKKAVILADGAKGLSGTPDVHHRDLLTLLIKNNMRVDIPDAQRMSDEEVLGQISTFILAGHETTSTGTTWCLFALTQAPDVQRKLRDELLSVETDLPTMDELSALPYLDMVVKESLRLHAPIATTVRVAVKDDVVPLSKPYTDRDGCTHDSVKVAAGDPVLVPILFLNRSKELWGSDASEFRPERWVHPPEATSSIPGVWANILTFLGGPRSCIGYRFAIIEMKALLFTLVRAFEFELAVPVTEVRKRASIVTRPLIASERDKGNQLPLLIKPYRR